MSGAANCFLDPCDERLRDEGFLCPRGFECAPAIGLDEGEGRCSPAGAVAGAICGAVGRDASPPFPEMRAGFVGCSPSMFCAAQECDRTDEWEAVGLIGPSPEEPPPYGEPGSFGQPGRCLPFVREGQRCDSDAYRVIREDGEVIEGSSEDFRELPVGCRQCEPGTQCLEDFLEIGTGAEGERRCVRSCEHPDGTQDPNLCACGREQCEEHDGRMWCVPCTASNTPCDPDAASECCDGSAGCIEVELGQIRQNGVGSEFLCCRPEGADCGSAPNGGCCVGTRCIEGECEECGMDGDGIEPHGCCPGFAPFTATLPGGNEGLCVRCGSPTAYSSTCSDHELLLVSEEGVYDTVAVPVTGLPPSDDPFGMSGGNLYWTAADVVEVRYKLNPRHRLYLFDNYLTDPVTTPELQLRIAVGDLPPYAEIAQYWFLPATIDDATPQAVPIPVDADAPVAVRTYDIGECSLFADWEKLAHLVAFGVLKEDFYSGIVDEVVHQRTTVWPILTGSPAHPNLLPLGPDRGDDRVGVEIDLDIDANGCLRDPSVRIRAELSVRASPLQRPDATVRALDDEILGTSDPSTGVRCDYIAPNPELHCWLVDPTGVGGVEATSPELFVITQMPGSGCPSGVCADEQVQYDVGCVAIEDRYRCIQPVIEPIPGTTEWRLVQDSPRLDRVRVMEFGRPLPIDPGNKTFRVRVESLDLSYDERCWLSTLGGARIRDTVTSKIPDAIQELEETLNGFAVGLNPRRVLVRPEGLEIVLSEGPSDPQSSSVHAAVAMLPTTGGLLEGLSCEEDRSPYRDPADDAQLDGLPFGATSDGSGGLPSLNGVTLCEDDDSPTDRCEGICPAGGYICSEESRADDFGGNGPGGAGQVCAGGACCDPSNICPHGGGEYCLGDRFSNDGKSYFVCGDSSGCEMCDVAVEACSAGTCVPL